VAEDVSETAAKRDEGRHGERAGRDQPLLPVSVRWTSRWIVVTEMETIVKSIITIAMAGTSGHRTL
jgi:hypothetical protein